MRLIVLVLFILGLGGRCLAGEKDDTRVNQDSCSQYCGGTYPEHTYPNPKDHSACARGCRLARVDALIAWPFKPDPTSCINTCDEAYRNDHHLFACKLGCNVSTIDQKIPNRDHIYPKLANASEPGFVRDLLGNSIGHQLPQFVLVSGDVVELTQHAEMMYQFLPHGGASTFVIIEDDGESMEIQYGYNFDDSSLSNHEWKEKLYHMQGEEPYSSETSTYHFSCPWKNTHYAVAGRLLFFVAVGLIAVALFTCCCASLMPEEGERISEKKKKSVQQVDDQVYIATHLKSPVTFSPGYPQPVPYYGEKKNLNF